MTIPPAATNPQTLREAAIRAASRNWAVFPLSPRTKIPLVPKSEGGRGCLDASCDIATVDAWWERTPDANIGLSCGTPSGVFVVDIDLHLPKVKPKPGQVLVSGVEAWAELLAFHGVIATAIQHTGGGGQQYVFRLPSGREVKNRVGTLLSDGRLAAIDVRSTGGYVVLPPSIHPDGPAYTWLVRMPPADCPAWLLDLVAPIREAPAPAPAAPRPLLGEGPARKYLAKVLDTACAAIASTIEGRHDAINRHAFTVGGWIAGNPGVISEGEAETALVAAGLATGKSEREVRRTVRDALTKGQQTPIAIPERDFPQRAPQRAVDHQDDAWGGPAAEADEPPADVSTKDHGPKVNVTGKQGYAVVLEAWQVLLQDNRFRPVLFRLGGKLARLHHHEGGSAIELCLPIHVQSQLMRSARWMRTRPARRDEPSKAGYIEIPAEGGPPPFIAADLVATPHRDLPVLEQVVYAPVFARDGALLGDPGYHPAEALWYQEPRPITPVPMALSAARALLEDWLADFPFASQADRAHALGLYLLPFVRRLIDGPTPVHLIEAPQPGTGKSLLGQVLMTVAHGRPVPLSPWDAREEERKKTITTFLTTGRQVVFFDNVKGRIESPSFENATTSRRWADRILGVTGEVEVAIHAVWVMTSNNATMSPDMARRSARIRLVRHKPFDPMTARHADIEAWTMEHHSELVSAAVALVMDWLSAGRPPGRASLPTYESWARIVGGILEHAGIVGFLGNREAFLERADPTSAEWIAFFSSWINEAQGASFSVTELLKLADKYEILQRESDGASERARVTRFGAALRSRIDVQYEGRVLKFRRVLGVSNYLLDGTAEVT